MLSDNEIYSRFVAHGTSPQDILKMRLDRIADQAREMVEGYTGQEINTEGFPVTIGGQIDYKEIARAIKRAAR